MSQPRRSPRNQENGDNDREIIDVLTAICNKLDKLTTIESLLRDQLNKSQEQDQNFEAIGAALGLQINTENEVNAQVSTSRDITNELNKLRLIETVSKSKKYIREWRDLQNKRHQAYFNSIRDASQSEIYQQFLARTPPYVPQKHRIKDIPNEPQNERDIRLERCIEDLRMEINLLKERSKTQEAKYKSFDSKALNIIDTKHTGIINEKLKEKWAEETSSREIKAQESWAKKKEFLMKLPEKENETNNDENSNERFIVKKKKRRPNGRKDLNRPSNSATGGRDNRNSRPRSRSRPRPLKAPGGRDNRNSRSRSRSKSRSRPPKQNNGRSGSINRNRSASGNRNGSNPSARGRPQRPTYSQVVSFNNGGGRQNGHFLETGRSRKGRFRPRNQ